MRPADGTARRQAGEMKVPSASSVNVTRCVRFRALARDLSGAGRGRITPGGTACEVRHAPEGSGLKCAGHRFLCRRGEHALQSGPSPGRELEERAIAEAGGSSIEVSSLGYERPDG
jgi:hypothetical protein